MSISATGARTNTPATAIASKALPKPKDSEERGSVSPVTVGLLGGGAVALAGGIGLRMAGMGRIGTGVAALGGALLGASLLAACGTRREPVPGDDGPPGENVMMMFDRVGDLPRKDRTNPPPKSYVAESGTRDSREGVAQIVHDAAMGSAWVVEPGMLVTNYHVAQGQHEVDVVDHAGRTHAGTVVRLDRSNDLALVSAPTLKDDPLPMDDVVTMAETGETTGYPGGTFANDEALAFATIGVDDDGRVRDAVMFNGTSDSGVSGGAVINGSGEVLGTAFATGALDDEPLVLAIPNERVQGLLDAHRSAGTAQPAER